MVSAASLCAFAVNSNVGRQQAVPVAFVMGNKRHGAIQLARQVRHVTHAIVTVRHAKGKSKAPGTRFVVFAAPHEHAGNLRQHLEQALQG